MSGDLEFLRRAFRDVPNCHLSTIDQSGAPHVAPRWFVWLEDGLFISTRRGDASWENVLRDPRVSMVVDRGRDWTELTARLDAVPEAHREALVVTCVRGDDDAALAATWGCDEATAAAGHAAMLGFLRELVRPGLPASEEE